MGVGDVEDFLEKQTGFDISRFRADRNVDEAKDFVQWDRRQGTRAGVRGTPTVFVCDRKVEFVAKWSELEELIDKLINDYLAQATD
jgi:predicted DsbA family dithiol-disulfide isomerase